MDAILDVLRQVRDIVIVTVCMSIGILTCGIANTYQCYHPPCTIEL